jgi:hypothetical protein
MRMGLVFSLVLAALSGAGQPPPQPSPARAAAEKAYREALARPTDPAALEAFRAILPRVGEYYVVEGDRRLTEDQLFVYVAQLAGGAHSAAPRSGELLVQVTGGKSERWCQAARDLTYAVDRASFGEARQYETVVRNVAAAAREWEGACPECRLSFTHLREHDAAPSHEKVVFIVKGFDSLGAYFATAFFPSDPPMERFLYVDPLYFTTEFDKVGVLRHELGHVLGYRHEHIQDVPGCYREDRGWMALGPYDPKSVMHYPCGGGGGQSFALSASDQHGHRTWYSKPDGGEACAHAGATR